MRSVGVESCKQAAVDLVLATQGRSFWILDNLTPLHQWKQPEGQTLFKPRDAVRSPARGGGGGLGRASGVQYPPVGATLDYFLARVPEGDVKLDVLDALRARVEPLVQARKSRRAFRPSTYDAPRR